MKLDIKKPLILTTLISITLLSGCGGGGDKEQSTGGGGNQEATGGGGDKKTPTSLRKKDLTKVDTLFKDLLSGVGYKGPMRFEGFRDRPSTQYNQIEFFKFKVLYTIKNNGLPIFSDEYETIDGFYAHSVNEFAACFGLNNRGGSISEKGTIYGPLDTLRQVGFTLSDLDNVVKICEKYIEWTAVAKKNDVQELVKKFPVKYSYQQVNLFDGGGLGPPGSDVQVARGELVLHYYIHKDRDEVSYNIGIPKTDEKGEILRDSLGKITWTASVFIPRGKDSYEKRIRHIENLVKFLPKYRIAWTEYTKLRANREASSNTKLKKNDDLFKD